MVKLDFQYDFGSGFYSGGPPRNWKALQIQIIFALLASDQSRQQQLQSLTLEFVLEEAKRIRAYKNNGLLSGTGILEGPGFRIFIGDTHLLIFDGCIDTVDKSFSVQGDMVTCTIKESGKIDWLNDVAQSITFEYLTSLAPGSPGYISRADYKQTPYAISTIPDFTQAALLSVSLFVIIKESVDVVARIASLITRAISQSLSWLQLVGTIVEIVLYLLYLIAIIAASARLMQQIADNLLQPKKTKLCMREQDLFKKFLEFFGLNYVSSIHGIGTAPGYNGRYINATWMPSKIRIPAGDPSVIDSLFKRPADETTNPKSYGYYDGTAKAFYDDMCSTYDGIGVIRGNNFYFENRHNFNNVSPFQIPNEGFVGNTFNYPEPYGTNADEIPLVYILRSQKDDQEINTYNDYTGSYAIAQTRPNIIRNQKNLLSRGATNVDLPFALARRKVGYTRVEKALLELFSRFGNFINDIGNGVDEINDKLNSWLPSIVSSENVGFSNTQVSFLYNFIRQPDGGIFTGPIAIISAVLGSDGLPIIPAVTIPNFGNDRIGWMLLSNDFIGVPKRFIGVQSGDDWLIDENNSAGTYLTINDTTLNGVFTGTIIGVFGATLCTGTVFNGVVTITASAGGIGAGSGVVNGTISGFPGTFTAYVTGFTTGGTFTGFGGMSSSTMSAVSTQGWGGCKSLMEDFHVLNMLDHNQYITYRDKRFKMSVSDYLQIAENNILRTPDGRVGKFEKIIYDLHNDQAISVDYRVKQRYTNNFTTTISTDGG